MACKHDSNTIASTQLQLCFGCEICLCACSRMCTCTPFNFPFWAKQQVLCIKTLLDGNLHGSVIIKITLKEKRNTCPPW